MFFKFLRFLDIPTDPTRRQGSTSETSALREWLRNLGVAESSLFLVAFGLMGFKSFVFRFQAVVSNWLCFVLVPGPIGHNADFIHADRESNQKAMWLQTQSRSMFTGATTTALGMVSNVSRGLCAAGVVGARKGTFFAMRTI